MGLKLGGLCLMCNVSARTCDPLPFGPVAYKVTEVAQTAPLTVANTSDCPHAVSLEVLTRLCRWRKSLACDFSEPRLSNGQTIKSAIFVPHGSLDVEIIVSMAALKDNFDVMLCCIVTMCAHRSRFMPLLRP